MANMFVQQNFDVDASNIESNGAFGSFLACSFIRDTAFKFAGAGALKVTWPAPSGGTASWVNHTAISGFIVGRWYQVKAMVYVPPGNPDLNGFVAFQYGPGPAMTTKGQWVEFTFAFVPSNSTCFIGWGTASPQAGGIAWIDNISVDLLVHPAELDADLPRPLLVGPTENNLRDRDFETRLRFIESNTAFNTKLAATRQLTTEQAHTGTQSIKVTPPTPDGVKPTWVNTYGGFKNLVIGRRYRFTAWVYNPSGGQDRLKLEVLFQSTGAYSSVKDQWVMLEHEFVASNTSHHLGVTTGDPAVAASWYTDDWRLAPVPAYKVVLDAVLPKVTGSILGRIIRRMVYTVTGWKVLYRRKWPGS